MKNILIVLLSLFGSEVGYGQILVPIHWSYAAKKTNSKEAFVFLKASIDAGWHIYSIAQKDGGPVKTTFSFTSSPDYALLGDVIEPQSLKKHENVFDMDVHYFEKSAVFRQKIKLKYTQVIVKGKIEFMACTNSKCLPPELVSFSIPVK